MSEFGNQYNSLQGFAYSATAIINALAELNNTLSSISASNSLQKISFDNNGYSLINTTTNPQTYILTKGSCTDCVGFILQADVKNTNIITINGAIALKPGSIFVLTVEQNRIFSINTVSVEIKPNDAFYYLPICVS